MTTYTYQAIKITNGDELTVGPGELQIVVPDREQDFNYTVTKTIKGDLPEVELANLDSYLIALDGSSVGANWTISMGKVLWAGNGQKTFIMEFVRGDETYLVEWGGDMLPSLNSAGEWEGFVADARFRAVDKGTFGPEGSWGLSGPATVVIEQDDHIGGTSGRDTLEGGNGRDVLIGRGARDILVGGKGKDELFGGRGNDILDGVRGDDTMTGGGASDIFVFGFKGGNDVITDYTEGKDSLLFHAALWGGFLTEKQVVKQFAEKVGNDIVFTFDTGTITLRDVDHGKRALFDEFEFFI